METLLNRFRFDRIVAMSLWPHFFDPRMSAVDAGFNSVVCAYNIDDSGVRGRR